MSTQDKVNNLVDLVLQNHNAPYSVREDVQEAIQRAFERKDEEVHWAPRYYGYKGGWDTVVVCPCGLHALYEDSQPVDPCPRCGNPLRYGEGRRRECVGRWIRTNPIWQFWKSEGYWEMRKGG